MNRELIVEGDEACRCLRELCALTSEDSTAAVVTALRERLQRVREASTREAAEQRSAALARPTRTSIGPGIPPNRSWHDVDV